MKKKLDGFPIFAALNAQVVDNLTKDFPRREFKRGDYIIRQGEVGNEAYLLFDGKVAVNVESKEGVRSSIIFHNAPFVFGIIELWQEHPYLGNVVAIEPCSVLVLDRKGYLKMLHSSHQVAISVVQLLSESLYQQGKDRKVALFGKIEHLLANTFCYFAQLYGEEHRYGILVRREINKSELAEMLGVARRSVIRGLKSLEEEKLIQLEEKQLVIPDLAALRKKANTPIS